MPKIAGKIVKLFTIQRKNRSVSMRVLQGLYSELPRTYTYKILTHTTEKLCTHVHYSNALIKTHISEMRSFTHMKRGSVNTSHTFKLLYTQL